MPRTPGNVIVVDTDPNKITDSLIASADVLTDPTAFDAAGAAAAAQAAAIAASDPVGSAAAAQAAAEAASDPVGSAAAAQAAAEATAAVAAINYDRATANLLGVMYGIVVGPANQRIRSDAAITTDEAGTLTVAGLVIGATPLPAIGRDAGWTPNADAGDKTASIGSAATLSAIATALDLVVAGAGTQLQQLAAKVKALESALASSGPALLPDA